MLDLLAVAYEDGYAFVRDRNSIYAIRPPYISRNKRPVSMSIVERAIAAHGFSPEDMRFNDWAALIDHLKTRFIEKRAESGQDKPDARQIKRLVQRAPQRIVLQYLENIESELIPNREWRAAIGLLTNLLRNKIVQENMEFLNRCADLLERCQNARDREEKERLDLIDCGEAIAEELPLVDEEAIKLARQVSSQGQVLVVGTLQ